MTDAKNIYSVFPHFYSEGHGLKIYKGNFTNIQMTVLKKEKKERKKKERKKKKHSLKYVTNLTKIYIFMLVCLFMMCVSSVNYTSMFSNQKTNIPRIFTTDLHKVWFQPFCFHVSHFKKVQRTSYHLPHLKYIKTACIPYVPNMTTTSPS
jgi:uncharacterized protein YqhQ